MKQIDTLPQQAFTGGPRFELRRLVGEGGFGTVYEALDREHRCIVALKHLRRFTADSLYSFKQEFRSLADLSHPNLVELYELLSHPGGNWLLVMEYIDGVDFLSYQAGEAPQPSVGSANTDGSLRTAPIGQAPTLATGEPRSTKAELALLSDRRLRPMIGHSADGVSAELAVSGVAPTQGPMPAAADGEPPPASPTGPAPVVVRLAPARNFQVLRDCLRQLADGLSALHAADKLHRDIKPSNILVTRAQRVVLLDFGLVLDAILPADRVNSAVRQVAGQQIVGTPAYMAPEQFIAGTVGPAADWYSVGVLLYEALTGQLPFDGDMWTLARLKQEREPVPVHLLRPDVPRDLDTLCAQLLRRDPAQRPNGDQVRRWLAGPGQTASSGGRQPRVPLLEREAQLAELTDCCAEVQRGLPTVVLLTGKSGMGKSTLARSFVRRTAASTPSMPGTPSMEELLVVSGRCCEQESVPYKALDGVVDMLSQYLRTLPAERVAAVLPADAGYLALLFPVLRQVPALRLQAEPQAEPPPEPSRPEEIRSRAFLALRTLLARLSASQPMVLWIDDLQWGDLDSAALLLEILRPPLPPRLLVLLCLRSDEAETSPTLRYLLPRLSALAGPALAVRRIEVGELSEGAARQLADGLLGPAASAVALPALESAAGRSPFFIAELARYLRDTGERPDAVDAAAQTLSANELLWRRVQRLRPAAQRALECLALIGRPALVPLLRSAAELGSEELSALHELRAGHFVRARQQDNDTLFEPYHDRICETVAARLPLEQRRAHHLRIATVLAELGGDDAEELARHYHQAAQAQRAAHYARIAARQALGALAFGRAADLLQNAIDWGAESDAAELYAELGSARSAIGQGRAAATAYLRAADRQTAERAVELRLRAADQLLRSGFLDEGMELLSGYLHRIGIRLPENPRLSALLGTLRRIYIDRRGLSANIRPESACPPELIRQLDAVHTVTVGYVMASTGRSLDLQSRHMQLALQAGEPFRLARALFLDAGTWATLGTKAHRRNLRYLERAVEVMRHSPDLRLEAYGYMSPGLVAYLEGRFLAASDLLREAEQRLRKCSGVAWEHEVASRYFLLSSFMCGDLEVVLARSEPLLRDAERRDDAYAEATLRVNVGYLAELFHDDPPAAMAQVSAAQARWVNRGFHGQHYWAQCAKLDILLYSGQWAEAHAHMRAPWMDDTRRLMTPYHEFARIMTLHRCGRAALAAASLAAPGSPQRRQLLAEAEPHIQQLLHEKASWAAAFGWHLRAGQYSLTGELAAALRYLARARTLCEKESLRLHAESLDYRTGQLLGGQAGTELCQRTLLEIGRRGARNPERLLAMVLPVGPW